MHSSASLRQRVPLLSSSIMAAMSARSSLWTAKESPTIEAIRSDLRWRLFCCGVIVYHVGGVRIGKVIKMT